MDMSEAARLWPLLDDDEQETVTKLMGRLAEGHERPPEDGPEWMSVRQAMEYTGMSRSAIDWAIRNKHLPATMPKGNRRGVRIRRRDIDRWMEGR